MIKLKYGYSTSLGYMSSNIPIDAKLMTIEEASR